MNNREMFALELELMKEIGSNRKFNWKKIVSIFKLSALAEH